MTGRGQSRWCPEATSDAVGCLAGREHARGAEAVSPAGGDAIRWLPDGQSIQHHDKRSAEVFRMMRP